MTKYEYIKEEMKGWRKEAGYYIAINEEKMIGKLYSKDRIVTRACIQMFIECDLNFGINFYEGCVYFCLIDASQEKE